MKLLCDLDIVLYRCLHATKEQGYYAGLRAADNTVDRILERFGYPDFTLAVSGIGNFRKKISPTYKSNRKPESRPEYLYDAKQWFKRYWGTVESENCEADDVIATLAVGDCVVASSDKDFRQLGVPLYNPWKDELVEVGNPHYHFYLQCLTGDAVDMVAGLKNPAKLHHVNAPCFTEATASKVLEGKTKEEMKSTVLDLYQQVHGENWFEKFDTCARLLFLRRKENQEYYEIFG